MMKIFCSRKVDSFVGERVRRHRHIHSLLRIIFSGESIEHLKTKAKETDKWGCNNITFSDSIQLSLDGAPTALVDVFNDIDSSLATKENQFPKSGKNH
ncbi:hypothetical protein PSJ55_05100 [Escherichia coli]|nr:hypothetical protein [Escherichia coli]MDC9120151.1 hypothetical protein [Escherichia coli]